MAAQRLFFAQVQSKVVAGQTQRKELMFVGDSLNHQQWESVISLVQSVIPPDMTSLSSTSSSLTVFKIELWKRRGGSFGEGPIQYDEVELPIAYERVLRTWAKWVEENVDPKHSSVYFSSQSPTHVRSLDWDNPDGIKCANETKPILNKSKPLDVGMN